MTAIKRLKEIHDSINRASPVGSDSINSLPDHLHEIRGNIKDVIAVLLQHHEVMKKVVDVVAKTAGRRIILED